MNNRRRRRTPTAGQSGFSVRVTGPGAEGPLTPQELALRHVLNAPPVVFRGYPSLDDEGKARSVNVVLDRSAAGGGPPGSLSGDPLRSAGGWRVIGESAPVGRWQGQATRLPLREEARPKITVAPEAGAPSPSPRDRDRPGSRDVGAPSQSTGPKRSSYRVPWDPAARRASSRGDDNDGAAPAESSPRSGESQVPPQEPSPSRVKRAGQRRAAPQGIDRHGEATPGEKCQEADARGPLSAGPIRNVDLYKMVQCRQCGNDIPAERIKAFGDAKAESLCDGTRLLYEVLYYIIRHAIRRREVPGAAVGGPDREAAPGIHRHPRDNRRRMLRSLRDVARPQDAEGERNPFTGCTCETLAGRMGAQRNAMNVPLSILGTIVGPPTCAQVCQRIEDSLSPPSKPSHPAHPW